MPTLARPHGRRAGPKLATVVREHILADIRSGRWMPGDRMPTEIELMARFGVSRAPIREAMQSLHLLGIVDISPRRGATVQALPVASVIDLAILSGAMDRERSVEAVFEFRDAMDAAIGELAAANASDAEIETLRAILADELGCRRAGATASRPATSTCASTRPSRRRRATSCSRPSRTPSAGCSSSSGG